MRLLVFPNDLYLRFLEIKHVTYYDNCCNKTLVCVYRITFAFLFPYKNWNFSYVVKWVKLGAGMSYALFLQNMPFGF